MSKSVMRMVVALVLGVMGLVGCVPAYAAEGTAPAGGWVLASTGAPVDVSETPACESEDQEYGPCLWDARTMGNGRGRSFIVEEDGSVSYLRWRDAREVAFPGWLWVGTVEAADVTGLPACADVNGEVTCQRDGRYVLEVNTRACTQTITTTAGDRYVPGPAVAKALSESCSKPAVKGHSDEAGLSGARSSVSTEVVHSPAASAVVDEPVVTSTSPSGDKVVGPVDSGVKDNYDREILVVAAVVTLGGLALAVWAERRATRRRASRFGSR
jgi:lipoprotein